jgi:hypothetical protein
MAMNITVRNVSPNRYELKLLHGNGENGRDPNVTLLAVVTEEPLTSTWTFASQSEVFAVWLSSLAYRGLNEPITCVDDVYRIGALFISYLQELGGLIADAR